MDSAQLQARLVGIDGVEHAEVADVVASTNERVAELVAGGRGIGAVAVAAQQSAGRGRRGRFWHDVPGGNVALSLGVALPTVSGGVVPLATALAVRDAFEAAGATTSIKWPNDVRLVTDGRPRKAAGILVEGHPGARPPAAVIGVGINVDWRARHPVEDSGNTWTSLAEAVDADVDREGLVLAVVADVVAWQRRLVEAPAQVLDAYRRACATVGHEVAVDLGTRPVPGGEAGADRLVGTATGIDERGCLVVTTARGDVIVAAGDVVHLRELR
ncbi:MAG TPA: biotin--[acetyl-CoA-carboxylase] ligase [Nitriliruptoraceae bacterium]|nr:biotin--[acetyl-CoA-carboxylase] ligase [Nitriliruptoraceae bacterium]